MRRFLKNLFIVIAAIVALAAGWIFGGRQLSLWADRFGTIQITSAPVNSVSYEGNGSGGILKINDLELGLDGPNPLGASPNVGTTKEGQVALSFGGKVFVFGSSHSPETNQLGVERSSADDASLSIRRTAIAWPTPFEVNFMTGNSPSWKRYLYYRLIWKKQSGAKLEMLWRYQQYFYPRDGWANGFMTDDSTGLIRIDISIPPR